MGRIAIIPLSFLGWIYYWSPGFFRDAWASALGFCIRKAGAREKVVRKNLELAFPSDPAQRERLFRDSYQHLAQLVLEVFMLFGPMKRFVQTDAVLEGGENWRAAHAQGKGVIFLSSHVGNWEVMSAVGGVILGVDLMLVTKKLKPSWLHEAIEKSRLQCGVRGTYEPKTMRDVLAHLKRGGTVGFVQDQYAGPPVGVRVPVFGVPVGTMSVAATLAKRTGIPVLSVVNYREKGGRYRVVIGAPVEWKAVSPETAVAENTAHYAEILEKDIYAHPAQWLWVHRRFKGDLSPLRPGEWSEGRARK